MIRRVNPSLQMHKLLLKSEEGSPSPKDEVSLKGMTAEAVQRMTGLGNPALVPSAATVVNK
jgi:hypothetical protein